MRERRDGGCQNEAKEHQGFYFQPNNYPRIGNYLELIPRVPLAQVTRCLVSVSLPTSTKSGASCGVAVVV